MSPHHSRWALFSPLRNAVFCKLYLAESVSLFGDAFTWLGIALISYQFGPERSAVILASALTLRVTAYVLFSPFAGVLADKVRRKTILWVTHFARMGLVALLPFITQEWQLYVVVFALNVFNGFFTPAYRAVIPNIVSAEEYRPAIGISVATFQVLGVLGPGIAGVLAGWIGVREIFLLDALSFVIAGVLVLSLPSDLGESRRGESKSEPTGPAWRGAWAGVRALFGHPYLRFALGIEFLAALAGAQILVNSIGHVKSVLGLDDMHYGWVMSAFALGAAFAAFASGELDKSPSRRRSLLLGAFLLGGSVALAGAVGYPAFLVLWMLAGVGQSLAEIPSETLIGENIAASDQGKVYGAHFAVSHLWWALAYPIAGWMGQSYPQKTFTWSGSTVTGCCLVAAVFVAFSKRSQCTPTPGWRIDDGAITSTSAEAAQLELESSKKGITREMR